MHSDVATPVLKHQNRDNTSRRTGTSLAARTAGSDDGLPEYRTGTAQVSVRLDRAKSIPQPIFGMRDASSERLTSQAPSTDRNLAGLDSKYAIPYLSSPGNEYLADVLSRIRTRTFNLSASYLQHSKSKYKTKPDIVQNPGKNLKRYYEILFGHSKESSWKTGADSCLPGAVSGTMLPSAILGAALYDKVFARAVPWASPIDEIKRFQEQGYTPYLEEASQRVNTPNFNLGSLLYKLAQVMICDKQSQESTVQPIAKTFEESLTHDLRPQLEALGVELHQNDNNKVKNRISAELTDILTEALVIRGQIQAAPSEYQFVWYPSGTSYDSEKMKLSPALNNEAGVVALCAMLAVIFWERPGNDWLVTSKASGYRKVDMED